MTDEAPNESKRRPRRRDDDPTRPLPLKKEGRGKPDTTIDLEEGDIEVIAGDEVLRGDPTRPVRRPK